MLLTTWSFIDSIKIHFRSWSLPQDQTWTEICTRTNRNVMDSNLLCDAYVYVSIYKQAWERLREALCKTQGLAHCHFESAGSKSKPGTKVCALLIPSTFACLSDLKYVVLIHLLVCEIVLEHYPAKQPVDYTRGACVSFLGDFQHCPVFQGEVQFLWQYHLWVCHEWGCNSVLADVFLSFNICSKWCFMYATCIITS